MIIGEIRRYLRDNNPIRVSRHREILRIKAFTSKRKIDCRKFKEPTAMDIAKVLEVTHEEIVFALDAIQDPVSLFEPIYNDGEILSLLWIS